MLAHHLPRDSARAMSVKLTSAARGKAFARLSSPIISHVSTSNINQFPDPARDLVLHLGLDGLPVDRRRELGAFVPMLLYTPHEVVELGTGVTAVASAATASFLARSGR